MAFSSSALPSALFAAAVLLSPGAGASQCGKAAWYNVGRNPSLTKTANDETPDAYELTAAHRTLPFGTQVLVENLSNGLSVVVRIDDRGPFGGQRLIDLSRSAAEELGMIEEGIASVRITALDAGASLPDAGCETGSTRRSGALTEVAADAPK
jgi:rare lipoprotein A